MFQQQTANGATTTFVGVSGASLWLGNDANPTVTNGQGAFVVQSDGMAGYISGTAAFDGTGFKAGGNVAIRVNTTGDAINDTVTLNGQTLTITFGSQEGHVFSVSIDGLNVDIAGIATLEGNVNLQSFTTSAADNSLSGTAFAGSGMTVFVGNGPALLADGSPNPLAQGLLISGATVGLFKSGNDLAFVATGTVQLVGVPGATLGGQVSVRVNTFAQAFTETLTMAGGGSVPLNFGPGEIGNGTAAFSSAGGTGLTLGVGGSTLTTDVTLTRQSGSVTLTLAKTAFSLASGSGSTSSRGPPIAQLTQGSGALTLTGAGLYGTVAGTVAVNVPGATVTGTLSLFVNTTASQHTVGTTNLPPGPYLELTGSPVSLTIGSEQLSGTFTFEAGGVGATAMTQITASGVTLTLAAGGTTILGLASGSGTLTVTSAGVSGSLQATVTTNALSSFFTLSTVAIALNTTNAPAAGLGAGPAVSVEADGVSLTVANQSITGDLAFNLGTDSGGNTVVAIAAANVNIALGSVGGVTGGSGEILVTSGSGLAASLTGSLHLTAPGVTASGNFTVQINSSATGAPLSQTFTVGGQTLSLSLPQSTGPYVSVLATGASLSVVGQTITGDLTVVVTGGGTPSFSLSLANGSLSLAGGIISSTALTGSLTLTSTDVSATLIGTLGINAPGISVNAQSIGVTFDSATSALTVAATGLTATIAGQTVSGDFAFATGTDATGKPDVTVTFANAGATPLLSLGPAASPLLTVAHGTGSLLITSAGVAGSLTVTGVTFPSLPNSMSATLGSFSLQLSTIPNTVVVASTTLPAGPYINVTALGLHIGLGGASLQGDFVFSEQTATDGSSQVTIAATGVTASAGTASLTSGQGAFIFTSGGVAGLLTGTAAAGDMNGAVSISGSVILRINTTTGPVNETVPVGGQSVQITFSAGEVGTSTTAFTSLSVSSLTLTLGTFVSIQGNITYTSGAFSGSGLTVFLGQGPAYLASGQLNPGATGILLANAQVGLLKGTPANTYALYATGTVTVLGVPGVTIGGTVTVQYNDTGSAQQVTIPNSANPVTVQTGDTTTPYTSASVTGGQLVVFGQSLQGNFGFAPTSGGGGVTITASAVGISLGGGAVTVSAGAGTLTFATGGVYGSLNATVATSISGAQFAGSATFTLDVNTTATVQGTLPAGPYVRVDTSGTVAQPAQPVDLGQVLNGGDEPDDRARGRDRRHQRRDHARHRRRGRGRQRRER